MDSIYSAALAPSMMATKAEANKRALPCPLIMSNVQRILIVARGFMDLFNKAVIYILYMCYPFQSHSGVKFSLKLANVNMVTCSDFCS